MIKPQHNKISLVFNFLFSKSVLQVLIILTFIVFLFSMWNRFIYIDDAFFGEQAYWLAKDGVVKTVSLIDFLGCDIQLFSYHKFNILIGAGLIKIFGWSVTPLRVFTLILYFIFIAVFVQYSRKLLNANTLNQQILIGLFFLIANPLIVIFAFTYRPEIWVMLFGFISFVKLDQNINSKVSNKQAILSGFMAGLAFLTHLNGLIFLVAGAVLLLYRRQWQSFVRFSVAGFFTSILYFADLWQEGHFETWLYQLKNWPDNNATNYLSGSAIEFAKNVVIKLSQEHQRFFWSPKVWGISSFFILVLLFHFKRLVKIHTNLIIYVITLVLSLNILGSQIAERFLIYIFPYLSLIISYGLISILHEKRTALKFMFTILLIIQIVTVVISFVDIFNKNAPHVRITENIFSRIPDKQGLILTPYNMVFNTLDKYTLASFKAFEYKEVAQGHAFSQSEFFKRADTLNIKTIVLPLPGFKNTDTGLDCFSDGIINDTSLYHPYYKGENYVILIRNKSDNQ